MSSTIVNKILLQFRVSSSSSVEISNPLIEILEKHLKCQLSFVTALGDLESAKFSTKIYSSADAKICSTIKIACDSPDTLVIVDVDLLQKSDQQVPTVTKLSSDIHECLKALQSPSYQQIPLIKLGQRLTPYLTTSDNRVIEYGYKSILLDQDSKYQRVQVVDTVDFGKMLILDGNVNLAESDRVSYTHSLMGISEESDLKFKDSQVLILGGGDGGLLKELLELRHPPNHVTMVDIDALVLDACTKYMPSVCGNYLREMEGPNFKIIVEDAIKCIEDYQSNGTKFDFIFCDLTDTPYGGTGEEALGVWDFLEDVLKSTLKILHKTGSIMTHCNGKNVPEVLQNYEQLISNLSENGTRFQRRESFVPSFMETWIFYEISHKM